MLNSRIFILSSSAAASQILLLLASPLLTRIYSPEDFGMLALYVSIVNVSGLVVAGRYEQALYISKSSVDKRNLVHLSTIIIGIVFIISTVISSVIQVVGKDTVLGRTSLLLPAGLATFGLIQLFTISSVSDNLNKTVANARIIQALAVIFLQIFLFRFGGIGLIAVLLFGQIVATILLKPAGFVRQFLKANFESVRYVAGKYKHFPLYNAPTALINGISLNIIPVVIFQSHGATAAGLYALVQRTIGLPMGVVGVAISQHYAVEFGRANSVEARYRILFKTLRSTFPVAIIVFLLSISTVYIFPYIFGNEWRVAGIYAAILSPAAFMQMLISPISQTPVLLQKNRSQLMIDSVRLCFMAICIFYARGLPDQNLIVSVSVVQFLSYIGIAGICFYMVKTSWNHAT